MILDEEIIQLAKQHLEWEVDENDETWIEYFATSQHIIEFAQKIFEMGYNEGSYDMSYFDG
ncbi:MAG: hypothetical protein EB127_28855 [Alphaproteobacteria bacterium]|jgi:hypothetical protein|nr:hypothetical protein [Alphaproteobacteria bacterium]